MIKNPLVSIVIPVYNGTNYLQKAIDSCLGQTYKNIELVVVNDGSTDDGATEQLALTYGNKIRYYKKENGGVATALNLGIEKMKGEYFVWLSHDEYFVKKRIEKDIEFLSATPEAKIVFSRHITYDKSGKLVESVDRIAPVLKGLYEIMLLGGIHFCNITIHKSCLAKSGVFDVRNRMMQDVQMTLTLVKHYDFYFNDFKGTILHDHDQRDTHTLSTHHMESRKYLAAYLTNFATVVDFFPDWDVLEKQDKSTYLKWLGDYYSFLCDDDRANEYYGKSYEYSSNIFSFITIYKLLGSRIMNNRLFTSVKRIIKTFSLR